MSKILILVTLKKKQK